MRKRAGGTVAVVLILGTVLMAIAWPVGGAEASFPGSNGDIAYVVQQSSPFRSDIHVMSPDGSAKRRLTALGDATAPAWSADGARIAFHRFGAEPGIYVMNADGSAVRRLTMNGSSPAWSPDGLKIAFEGVLGSDVEIVIVDVRTGDTRRLTNTRSSQEPRWAPDGSQILFEKSGGIFVINPDGTGLQRIAGGYEPDWSPDGARITFVRLRYDPSEDDYIGDIWMANADGSRPTDVSDSLFMDEWRPTWSPDGMKLTYFAREGVFLPFSVYVMNSDGTGVQRLTADEGDQKDPDWQPVP